MNLLAAIKAVPDHRHPRGIRHPLWLILTIVLLGSCAGYWGYKPLVEFTKNHRSTLIKIFSLPPDIRFPSNSTFRNIIHSLDFEVIAVLFNRPLAKKISVIMRSFKFNRLELTHNCKFLTTNYNADHNGDDDSDNDSTKF